jgi:triphosphatase
MNESDLVSLRFAIAPSAASRLRLLPCLKTLGVARATRHRIATTYWDTSTLALHQRGWVLQRSRIDDGPWSERLCERSPDGHFRIVDDADGRDGEPARNTVAIAGVERHALRPVAEMRVTTSARTVSPTDRTQITLAIARGAYRHGLTLQRRTVVRQLGMTLVRGEPADLLELACAVVNEAGSMRLLFGGEVERAYALITGTVQIVRRTPASIDPTQSAACAAHRAADECIAQIVGNIEGARQGDDESIHQLRVGIRRFRSVVAIRREAALAPMPEDIRTGVKWIWGMLGAARDWDVFVEQTWPAVGQPQRVAGAACAYRQRSHANLRRALDGKRFQLLVLAMFRFNLQQRAQARGARTRRSSRKIAQQLLDRHARKFRKRSEGLIRLSEERLHRLRIAAKRLRYVTEFFRGVFDTRAQERYLARLVIVQSVLGQFHDLAVGGHLVDRIAHEAPASSASSGPARFQAYRREAEPRLRERLAKEMKKLRQSKPFWH